MFDLMSLCSDRSSVEIPFFICTVLRLSDCLKLYIYVFKIPVINVGFLSIHGLSFIEYFSLYTYIYIYIYIFKLLAMCEAYTIIAISLRDISECSLNLEYCFLIFRWLLFL